MCDDLYQILPPPDYMGNLFSGNCGFWTGNFQLRLNAFLAVKITANNYRSILRKKTDYRYLHYGYIYKITKLRLYALRLNFLQLGNYGYMCVIEYFRGPQVQF